MKLIILILIASCIMGCGWFNKQANQVDSVIVSVDVKVTELKEVYENVKLMYLQKVKTYKFLKLQVYGESGETEIWKYLVDNDIQTINNLKELDSELIKINATLIIIDNKISDNYLKWQDFKIATQKITDGMRKIDVMLNTLNEITKIVVLKVK